MVTVYKPKEELLKMMQAFKEGGGGNKPFQVQMAFSYARNENEALISAHHQWRSNLSERADLAGFSKVEEFDKYAESVTLDDVKRKLLVSSNLERHLAQILEVKQLGVENIILHNVGRHQEEFIQDFGANLIPALLS